MKYKNIFLLTISLLLSLTVHAQKLTIEGMTASSVDLSASQFERKDLNGNACGLVKVQLAAAGAQFEGNVIGQVSYKTGEYWVYMTEGSYMLSVKHPSFVPIDVNFRDYGISGITGKSTYKLTLLMPQTGGPVQTQKLTINYSPADAIVLVDSKPYKGNGRVEVVLPIGNHNYIIAAEGYESAEGSVKLTAASPRAITEELSMSKQLDTLTPTNIQKPIDNDQSITEKLNNSQQQTTNQDVLEDFVSKMCGMYNVELSKTSMSELETLYGVKQKKGKEHYEICIKAILS